MPRWLSPLGRRLHPVERLRVSLGGLALGALVVEFALVLLALPAVLSAVGNQALAAACRRVLGDLAPGGLQIGWAAGALALLLPLLARRGWTRAQTQAEETRIEASLGRHRAVEGIELVQLPTRAVVAYSVDGPEPQVVVSDGLVELLSSEELGAVLEHELAHLRVRHGRALRALAAIEAAVPLARWATQPVRIAIERCADELATSGAPERRAALLDALLQVASCDGPDSVAAFTSRSGVLERARALLVAPPTPTRMQRVGARSLLVAGALTAVVAAAAWAVEAHMMLSMAGICRM